jgi:hypothetical protein
MTRAFHVVDCLGGSAGVLVSQGPRLDAHVNRTIGCLHRQFERESAAALSRGKAFSPGWDPSSPTG